MTPTPRSVSQRNKDRETIRRSGAGCGICGEPIDYGLPHMDPMQFVVDHIVPLAHGGRDDVSNKQAAHRTCNRTKGARLDGGRIIRKSGSLVRPGG